MKTYIFDLIKSFQRKSEALDVKTVLCNKSWILFSDSGEKEIYVFMEDGKLIISTNGKVTIGSWIYLTANKSLVISGNDQSYLVHPYIFSPILALVQDNTNNCAFLLDDSSSEIANLKNIQSITKYIKESICKKESNQVTRLRHSNYYFGENGIIKYQECDKKHEHPIHYIEMRQVNRTQGKAMNGTYCFQNSLANANAFTSDGSTFMAQIINGHLKSLHYSSHGKFPATFCWSCNPQAIEVRKWLVVSYKLTGKLELSCCYMEPKSYKVISEEEWMQKYGTAFKEDLLRFRTELHNFLGLDPVSTPYWKQLGEL